MAAVQEVPVGDDELDSLMAQLEEETATAVAPPPKVVAAPVAKPAGEPSEKDQLDAIKEAARKKRLAAEAGAVQTGVPTDDLDALAAELEEKPLPVTPAVAAKIAALADDVPFEPTSVVKAPPPAPVQEVAVTEVTGSDIDDEMAALEAELAGTPATPDPAPQTTTMAVIEEGIAAAAATSAPPPVAAEDEPAHPNPPKKAVLDFDIDVDQFRVDTRVSETNLDSCFMEQAGLIAHYVKIHAHAEAQAARTKLQVEIAEARLYDRHRKELAKGPDKVTEKAVENAVKMDPQYAKIQVLLIDAESKAAVAKGLVESLKQRRDMLIQLGADRREDGKGAVRILAAQAAAGNLADRARAVGNQAREG